MARSLLAILFASLALAWGQDTTTVRFTATLLEVRENTTSAMVTVERSGDQTGTVTVEYATADGTAMADQDYVAVAGRLTFAPAETEQVITIPILNDAHTESLEYFRLALSTPIGATLQYPSNVNIRIQDNDGGVRFEANQFYVSEDAGSVALTVLRGNDMNWEAFTVDYATTIGSATTGEDYAPTTGTLEFPAGAASRVFTIPIMNDGLREATETFSVALSNLSPGFEPGSPATATVLIEDNDPGVAFDNTQFEVAEDNEWITLTVARGNDVNLDPFTVDYATTDGTAKAGEDYVATSGTLNFDGGEQEQTITVGVLNDGRTEPSESFTLTLSNPTGGVLLASPASTSVVIKDNDRGISFSRSWYFVEETAGFCELSVRVENDGPTPSFSVNYTTRDQTALAGEDYEATSGQIDFAADEKEKSFTVPIRDDGQSELMECFTVTLSSPSAGMALGAWSTATIGIAESGVGELRPVGGVKVDVDRGYPLLEWANAPGQVFRLEATEDLGAEDWRTVALISADSPTASWLDESDRPKDRYYRVVRLNEGSLAVRLQQVIERARSNSAVPGISAAVVLPDGDTWVGTSGTSYVATNAPPIRPQTRFNIASITKTMAAAVILQLVDEGKLTLDDPIRLWLPDVADRPGIIGSITIRQLLNHTSGLGEYIGAPGSGQALQADLAAQWSAEEIIRFILPPPSFLPGRSWEYCNSNFILLAMIAEQVTGNPFVVELHRRFLDPLRLSGTYLAGWEPLAGEFAVGHNWQFFGGIDRVKLIEGEPESVPLLGLSWAWTCCGVTATAENVARWGQALYSGSLLSPPIMAEMTTIVPGSWSTSGAFPMHYGLGCRVFYPPEGGVLLGHTAGNTSGQVGLLAYSPEHGYSLALLLNRVDNTQRDRLARELVALLDKYFEELAEGQGQNESD